WQSCIPHGVGSRRRTACGRGGSWPAFGTSSLAPRKWASSSVMVGTQPMRAELSKLSGLACAATAVKCAAQFWRIKLKASDLSGTARHGIDLLKGALLAIEVRGDAKRATRRFDQLAKAKKRESLTARGFDI